MATKSFFFHLAEWGQPEYKENFPCVSPNGRHGHVKTNANVMLDTKWVHHGCFDNFGSRQECNESSSFFNRSIYDMMLEF